VKDDDAASDRTAILGLVLDGGRARRMGGVDKGLVILAGRPMMAHAIERLRPQVGLVAISANGDPARFKRFGLPVVADDPPNFSGPLAGVLAGLEFCARLAPAIAHVATLPGDTPFAPRDFVARLHGAQRAARAKIAVAVSGGRTHHVAALWPVKIAGALRRAIVEEGLRKVESFATRFAVVAVEWPVEPFDPFANVNTPEDLARAEAALAEASRRGGVL
jgi:molybdopterin-guanine dinucleotide biosynthesis protein A